MTAAQGFETNEYVSVCYSVACTNTSTYDIYGASGKWSSGEIKDAYFEHSEKGCKNSSNNIIRIGANNVVSIVEDGTNITTGYDNFDDNNGNGIIDAGDTIYWHTESTAGRKRKWNHLGTLVRNTASFS